MYDCMQNKLYTLLVTSTVAEPEGSQVLVETAKKEDRRNEPFYASFKSFVSMYQADSVYMVDSVPEHLQSDVPLVFPLQVGRTV